MPMSVGERLAKARAARKANKNKSPRKGGTVKQYIRKKDGGLVQVELTKSKGIKALCTECMGYGEAHPKDCPDYYCPVRAWRGKITLAY